jgi:hypothetical protein
VSGQSECTCAKDEICFDTAETVMDCLASIPFNEVCCHCVHSAKSMSI